MTRFVGDGVVFVGGSGGGGEGREHIDERATTRAFL